MTAMARRVSSVVLGLFAAIACGARSEIGAPPSADASADEATPDNAETGLACATCGTSSDGVSCTAWVACPADLPTDGGGLLCNALPHQIDCTCASSTCTCSLNGVAYKTVSFSTACPCSFDHPYTPDIFPQEIVEACGL